METGQFHLRNLAGEVLLMPKICLFIPQKSNNCPKK
jgi:hypothetical protein